ncbi:unnamed protein product [Spodoptera exigua]|nr:unnamed protein product [Spodoptera exigua]
MVSLKPLLKEGSYHCYNSGGSTAWCVLAGRCSRTWHLIKSTNKSGGVNVYREHRAVDWRAAGGGGDRFDDSKHGQTKLFILEQEANKHAVPGSGTRRATAPPAPLHTPSCTLSVDLQSSDG